MPRTYKRKTNKEPVNEKILAKAVKDVITKKRSLRKAANHFNIKRATLQRHVKKVRVKKNIPMNAYLHEIDSGSGTDSDYKQDNAFQSKYSSTQVFTRDEEEELCSYIIKSSDLHYGLTYRQIQILAYQYANQLENKKYPITWDQNKVAGVEWLRGFMKRHPNLSLRKPENTSIARLRGFNKQAVSMFFNNYKSVLEKYKFTAKDIYNLDETGVTTVLKNPKVVSQTGRKQVGQIASGERGSLITFVGIINATGSCLPPAYVFPRGKYHDTFLNGAPIGSMGMANKNGWINGTLFIQVLKHIKSNTNCCKDNKILLVMDNHESHTSLDAINYCRENGMVLLSIPPHTSHRLQPLDISVFGPFKTACSVALHDWMLSNSGRVPGFSDMSAITKTAYLKTFTLNNIQKGFSATGIWPVNSQIFADDDFITDSDQPEIELAIDVTAREARPANESNENEARTMNIAKEAGMLSGQMSTGEPATNIDKQGHDSSQNGYENIMNATKNIFDLSNCSSSSKTKLDTSRLQTIRPHPKIQPKPKSTRGRKSGSSKIYTETPEKERIEQLARIKEEKKILEEQRKQNLKDRQSLKRKLVPLENKPKKRQKSPSSDSDSSIEISSRDSSDSDLQLEETYSIVDLCDDDILKVNDFVLVIFRLQKSKIHYVGRIEKELNNNEYEVFFFRHKGLNKFTEPDITDIHVVDRADIVARLPQPKFCPGTARSATTIIFEVAFSNYNMR